MTMFSRIALLAFASALLVGCAGGAGSSGIGMSGAQLASVEPTTTLGSGPLTPQALLGVAPTALSARLGAPAFKRSEPDAEVWQYAGGDCALFIYFYKTAHGVMASSYVDARKITGGPASTDACLVNVLNTRRAPVS